MQTQFHNGISPWAGLHVPNTGKKAKEQSLEARQKPAAADDAPHQKPRKPRKLDNQPRGEKVGTAILKPAEVRKIAALLAEADRLREQLAGCTHKAIAAKFGVSETTVCEIRTGLSWSSVTGITKGGTR